MPLRLCHGVVQDGNESEVAAAMPSERKMARRIAERYLCFVAQGEKQNVISWGSKEFWKKIKRVEYCFLYTIKRKEENALLPL